MAPEISEIPSIESLPMNGGNDRYSYVKNSTFQRFGVDSSKWLIEEAIAEKLDIEKLPNSKTFRIVDLGCSVGPNSIVAVQNIIQAVGLKYKSHGNLLQLSNGNNSSENLPDYHVFFSDHTSNDFNTLFASLPPERRYFAAGVPGSFYTRLFPQASLHFVHSSFALHWLSKVPKEVLDINSAAWNKGRITCTGAPDEVVEAYSAQYAKDMDAFLQARAQEMVCGGLMTILVPAIPNGTPQSQDACGATYNLMGSCLADMANSGMVDEAKVDSFNLPMYTTSPQEVEALVEGNGCFSIERLEEMLPSITASNSQVVRYTLRATMEGIIKQHFGNEIDLDHLFDLFSKKYVDNYDSIIESLKTIYLFVLLKRNDNVTH